MAEVGREVEKTGMRRAVEILSAAVPSFSGGDPETHCLLFETMKRVLADMVVESDQGTNPEEEFFDSFCALLGAFVLLVDGAQEAVGYTEPEQKMKFLQDLAMMQEIQD